MRSWPLADAPSDAPRAPTVLHTSDQARAISLRLGLGESLLDHQVHEGAWVVVISGEVEFTTPSGESVTGSAGLLLAFEPGERHAVNALSETHLLLLLTPWPGAGHPGAITDEARATVRHRAAAHLERATAPPTAG